MEVRLLGPFEVLVDGAPVAVPDRLRSLLAALALAPGQVVTVETLARAIWGEDLPGRVKGSLQTSVMRLRQAVGDDAIATCPGGYRLHADIDVERFHQLVERAKAAVDDIAERALLAGAVALRRGEALAGIPSPTLREEHGPLLDERFLAALERRVDLDLAANAGAELCGELHALVVRFPLREPLWERLIRALAGAGRTAEALAAYARCRDLFTDELGVEPNARLRQLHLDLLRAAEEPAPTEPPSPAP